MSILDKIGRLFVNPHRVDSSCRLSGSENRQERDLDRERFVNIAI
jgi:hypothetical protein